MTPTRRRIASLLLATTTMAMAMGGTAQAMHDTTTPDSDAPTTTIDKDKFEACELFGYRAYAHRVTAGEMDAGMWDDLVGAGWSLGFTGPTSPVLVSPHCEA